MIAFSFLFLLKIYAKDFSDFDKYQGKLERKIIEEKIRTFLIKDGEAKNYFELKEDAFILYDREKREEYVLQLKKEESSSLEEKKRESLSGIKIAIDPGHFGGKYAKLEERYIEMDPLEVSISAQFDEGTLAYLTALHLKELLEKEGAIVLISKDGIGMGVHEQDFFDWLKENPHLWSSQLPLPTLFRKYFNPLDLKARAAKINAFNPDATVIIHFNAHHTEPDLSSNSYPTEANFNLVFVPGAFNGNELGEQENRYEFLRLVASQDLFQSKTLSQIILNSFSEILRIPVVKESDGAGYLSRLCLKVDEGIYARNLVMTRLVHGPLCYGETLIQNNFQESQILNEKDDSIAGIPCSSRLKEVASAYFLGLKFFFLSK